MKEQTSQENIHQLLSHIQRTLKAPKNQWNSYGKYSYRNKEDILNAVKSLLSDDQTITVTDDLVMIGERYYIKAVACLRSGDDSIFTTGFAREQEIKKGMDASQITGSTSTYAGKYALNNLFAIDDTKDADATNEGAEDEIDALAEKLQDIVKSGDWGEAALADHDIKIEVWRDAWGKLDSHKKGQFNKLIDKRNVYRDSINDLADREDMDGIRQLTEELTEAEKRAVWSVLKPATKDFMNSTKEAS